MATSPFSEASYCKVIVPRLTHKRGRQGVAHDREPVGRAAFRGSDGLEPPKSVTVRKEEIDSLRGEKNVAAEIQRRMALLIQDGCRRGWLDAIQLGLLDSGLTELANAQSGCERIKHTPMQRHYDYFIRFFIQGERSISFGSRGDPCCSRKCLPLKMIPASRLVVRT